ncbi:MAG: adenosylcobinamide-GDP ribazoletransferase [Alphaproteobacteria bacterium]
MNYLLKTFYGFWQALGFLTTLPLPRCLFSKKYNLISPIAMGWVGIFIGAINGAVFVGLLYLNVFHVFAVMMTIIFGLLLSGALHEDGFADFCDGYFGKKNPKKILSIMRDSRIGSFGTLGLIILIYSRLTALVLMFEWQVFYIILVLAMAAGLSRMAMGLAMFLPIDNNPQSSIKHIAKPNILSLMVAPQILWLTIFFPNDSALLWWRLPLLLAVIVFGLLILFLLLHRQKQIPLTGDGLGFLQSITEMALLFFFLSYFGFQQ